jgi:hypothetical protein
MISTSGVYTFLLADCNWEIFMGVTMCLAEDSPAVENLLTSDDPNNEEPPASAFRLAIITGVCHMFLADRHVSCHLRGAYGRFEGTGLGLRAPNMRRESSYRAGVGFDLVAQDELGAWVAGLGGVELLAEGQRGPGCGGAR